MAQPTKDYTYPVPLKSYGTSSRAITRDASGQVAGEYYTATTATSGSSYGVRYNHKLLGAGGDGAAIRGVGAVVGVAGANVYGAELTGSMDSTASSSITGLLAGARVVADVALSPTGGTFCCLDLEDVVASTKTIAGATAHGFIRVANSGAGTGFSNLIRGETAIGSTSATALCSTVKTAATNWSHGIKIDWNGTAMWLMATTTSPAA